MLVIGLFVGLMAILFLAPVVGSFDLICRWWKKDVDQVKLAEWVMSSKLVKASILSLILIISSVVGYLVYLHYGFKSAPPSAFAFCITLLAIWLMCADGLNIWLERKECYEQLYGEPKQQPQYQPPICFVCENVMEVEGVKLVCACGAQMNLSVMVEHYHAQGKTLTLVNSARMMKPNEL